MKEECRMEVEGGIIAKGRRETRRNKEGQTQTPKPPPLCTDKCICLVRNGDWFEWMNELDPGGLGARALLCLMYYLSFFMSAFFHCYVRPSRRIYSNENRSIQFKNAIDRLGFLEWLFYRLFRIHLDILTSINWSLNHLSGILQILLTSE
jgi:hypothetical protein